MHRTFTLLISGIITMFSGCASYQSLPLERQPRLKSSLQDLTIDTTRPEFQTLPDVWKQHPINLNNGLDETEALLIAVANSPQLKAVRAQIHEAHAAMYASGLLPDPQLSISMDKTSDNNTGLKTAENFGLGLDMQQIISRGARQDAASAQVSATYLHVLWQEWQVIQQTRMLWRRGWSQQQQLLILEQQAQQAQSTWENQHTALRSGNATLDQEGLAMAPMMDAQAAVEELKRQLNTTVQDFHLLLGLDTSLPIIWETAADAEIITLPFIGAHLKRSLAELSNKRPDLLALQAGYQSQDQKVREQVLLQFPSFSIGANRLRDSAGIWSFGPFINLNLPIFNGNRGNVAMARATRLRLRDEYQQQFASAYIQTQKIATDQQLLFGEWQALKARLPQLGITVKRMAGALKAGKIDMLTFTSLRTAYFTQQTRVLGLEQALLEQHVALETLTGSWFANDVSQHRTTQPHPIQKPKP